MAFRYRQVTVQDGDMIDPEDWNENLRELTGEFNSYLDRDNIQEDAIVTTMIKPEAFHSVYQSSSATTYALDGSTLQWVGGEGNDADGVNFLEFEADVDGMVIVEWSGTWLHGIPTNLSTGNHRPLKNKVASFRILVNSMPVAELWRAPDSRKEDCGYIVGAAPIGPGWVRVTVEARIFKIDNKSGDISTLGSSAHDAYDRLLVGQRQLLVTYRRR